MQQKATILLEMKNILSKVENILNKDIVKQVCSQKVQILSSIFVVKKKDGRNRPAINLREINQSFTTFKNREPNVVEGSLTKNECMCKLDLKKLYISLDLSPND